MIPIQDKYLRRERIVLNKVIEKVYAGKFSGFQKIIN